MKIVDSNITAGTSLADKVWNDGMETAALHCEDRVRVIHAWGNEDDTWDRVVNMLKDLAEDFRKQKRLA